MLISIQLVLSIYIEMSIYVYIYACDEAYFYSTWFEYIHRNEYIYIYMCVTGLISIQLVLSIYIEMSNMYRHVCDEAYFYTTWLIFMWRGSCMCHMTHSYLTWLVHTWHDSIVRVEEGVPRVTCLCNVYTDLYIHIMKTYKRKVCLPPRDQSSHVIMYFMKESYQMCTS